MARRPLGATISAKLNAMPGRGLVDVTLTVLVTSFVVALIVGIVRLAAGGHP